MHRPKPPSRLKLLRRVKRQSRLKLLHRPKLLSTSCKVIRARWLRKWIVVQAKMATKSWRLGKKTRANKQKRLTTLSLLHMAKVRRQGQLRLRFPRNVHLLLVPLLLLLLPPCWKSVPIGWWTVTHNVNACKYVRVTQLLRQCPTNHSTSNRVRVCHPPLRTPVKMRRLGRFWEVHNTSG